MALPVIGTDTGSNAELVRHGETGLIVKIGDGHSLAAGIKMLLSDPALRRRMGSMGRQLVETKFSSETNVPLILDAMKAAVNVARAGTAD